ncbi:MAG: family 20 glycosylhydrolase [Clostridia bacterium]|nr:family 20 glycosylhydrolase [Clostridia bacterium]
MIFPIAKNFLKNDGFYTFKTALSSDNLYEFYTASQSCDDISFSQDEKLLPEEYTINIDSDGVIISHSTDEGAFRAVTTLFQLYAHCDGKPPFSKISDKPDFEDRGYLLDISSGRIPKPETLKTLIDVLALLKYNQFQLSMDDFCFKFPLIPQVAEGFECYTPEDMADLDRYCRERFIKFVPCQNCLGHMENWLSRDEYKHLAVGYGKGKTNTINPLLAESRKLIDDIFDSLLPCFSSEYVNVCMDEAGGLGKYELEEPCEKIGKDTFFMNYLGDLADTIGKKHGKKVMFWSDMINSYPDCFKMIPKDAIALEWGYEIKNDEKMLEHCRKFKEMGIDYYVCPSVNTHFAFTGRFDTASHNIRCAAEIGWANGAKGFLVTDWGGDKTEGHPCFGVWSFLPAALAGQYAWNVEEEQKQWIMDTFFERRAREFTDFFVFGKKDLSKYIQRLANYMLLEPERTRLGTMAGLLFVRPQGETSYMDYFNLKECGDAFYFDNVCEYVHKCMKDVEKLDIDPVYKREILINSKMVILASEFCKIRMNIIPDEDKIQELLSLVDEIECEFRKLWLGRNYEKGVECFLKTLGARKRELISL